MTETNNQRGIAAVIVAGIIALLLIVGGIYLVTTNNTEVDVGNSLITDVVDMADEVVNEKNMINNKVAMADYQYSGVLEDVSGGTATGMAFARYDDTGYEAYATFENLPELDEGFFYEGWVVRKSPMNVISSGALIMENGEYVNRFNSDEDLTDHTFYVLTLEPDDGDPAPAEHILEGTLVKN